MTKEIEALMILQNESFNYPCYTDNYLMESWNYIDIDSSKTKSRIPDDDINSIAIFSDICKTPKEQKMTTCSHVGSPFKPMDRTPNGSSPELTQLQNSHLLKMVSGNISTTQSQVMKQISPSNNNNNNNNNNYIQAVAGDSYEKQAINNIFDSLMLNTHKMWPSDISYPSDSTEPPGYGTEFVGHPSPDYSSSYSNSPPERYRNDFQFILGAAQASQNKNTEIPMVYLNKGQFYPITLQGVDSSAGIPCSKVKTVIMAVFENDKNPEMQLKCWNHWHARQPTAKQRVIDIADYKEVFSGISNIEEVAFNALSFIWNTNEEAKVFIGINSLSTDFSSQKGVKGVPLNLQIDTYDFSSGTNRLIHRAACQIKIFCDKGAERKMRDEERKRVRRRSKNVADSTNGGKQTLVSSSMGKDCTYFKALDDHVTPPVLFIPETHYSNLQRLAVTTSTEESDKNPLKRVACFSDLGEQGGSPPSKQPRREEQQRVLLYVRQESEEVFDALMLNSPTLRGLRQAISEKYGLQEDTIGKIFKKCKRGIFVNMDDNIIEHYSNHTAFLIEITEVMLNQYQVTLLEL
ncbi:grainyhead-like protein 3 homolog isoform X2 [Tachysurus fulvidraco]|uniref:grainyhead-like protein 3 homolog isoform X2 n=1 Tax=Tachysurus fulvidraco TaxID=1234273 RepID=UPI000F4D4FC9|nr:grainyhead-like protein 3 homolog isoform X2 [Tachysurus fulvidraco]